MTVAFKMPLTSANVNAKLISRTDDQTASGKIDFINGIEINGIELTKASGILDVSDTGGIKIPDGTTAQRPTAGNGVLRYNTTSSKIEGYESGAWQNLSSVRSYRNATTTDSITTADDTVLFSGASFTATLPTAVGNAGKQFTLIHGGTSISQAYTLNTTSSQTIGGIASGSYVLRTNGETVILDSDGANWRIASSKTNTAWADAGVMTIEATTTNPTKGSVQSVDKVWWRRVGDSAHFRYVFRQTNATGAATGSGDYLFKIPSSVGTIDTNKVTVYATVEGWNSYAANAFSVGTCFAGQGSSNFMGVTVVYDSSSVRMFGQNEAGQMGVIDNNAYGPTSTNTFYALDFIVPMTGWQP